MGGGNRRGVPKCQWSEETNLRRGLVIKESNCQSREEITWQVGGGEGVKR